jgi:hypothetical protein
MESGTRDGALLQSAVSFDLVLTLGRPPPPSAQCHSTLGIPAYFT